VRGKNLITAHAACTTALADVLEVGPRTQGFTLNVTAGELVTLTITTAATEWQIGELVDTIKQFELTPKYHALRYPRRSDYFDVPYAPI